MTKRVLPGDEDTVEGAITDTKEAQLPRLKRSDCSRSGVSRRRCGRGFTYLDVDGERVADGDLIARIKDLAIPPAWEDVWICPDQNGHIQATGFDDAGRKQYLYHEQWNRMRSTRKFKEMVTFSRELPGLRRQVEADITRDGIDRERVLACAVRLMDLGFFRIGSEQYADENSTYGVATILKQQVKLIEGGGVRFEYPAKGSQMRVQDIVDSGVRRVSERLMRRRSGPEDFLVYKEERRWIDVRSSDVNEYIHEQTGESVSASAKDFRTWNGTVLAAVELARGELPDSKHGRERRIRKAVEHVAGLLGNTPAVCRSSYVDPRVFDLFRNGNRIRVPSAPSGEFSPDQRNRIERRTRNLIEGD